MLAQADAKTEARSAITTAGTLICESLPARTALLQNSTSATTSPAASTTVQPTGIGRHPTQPRVRTRASGRERQMRAMPRRLQVADPVVPARRSHCTGSCAFFSSAFFSSARPDASASLLHSPESAISFPSVSGSIVTRCSATSRRRPPAGSPRIRPIFSTASEKSDGSSSRRNRSRPSPRPTLHAAGSSRSNEPPEETAGWKSRRSGAATSRCS